MPPRYAYWTILIDNKPTAFRARDREELLPTLAQLRRTSADVVMKWFARGRLWESQEAERDAQQRPPVRERRGRDWRPGGLHRDPRDRFKPRENRDRGRSGPPKRDKPWTAKPGKPWSNKPGEKPQGDRWPRRKPHRPPTGGGDRPSGAKGPGGPPHRDRPWHNKPRGAGTLRRRDERPRKKRDDEE
jgi:hypothetical protein